MDGMYRQPQAKGSSLLSSSMSTRQAVLRSRQSFVMVRKVIATCVLMTVISFSLWASLPKWLMDTIQDATGSSVAGDYVVSDPCLSFSKLNDRFACQYDYTRAKFDIWLDSQSTTLNQAMNTYQSRYNRPVPAWFQMWFEWSRAHGVPNIDDYDQLEKDLAPLRRSTVPTLKHNMQVMASENDVDVGRGVFAMLRVRQGNATCVLHREQMAANALLSIIQPVQHMLPDLEILTNFGADPVLRGPELRPTTEKLNRWHLHPDTIVEFEQRSCQTENNVINVNEIPHLRYKVRHNPCNPQGLKFLAERHGHFQHYPQLYNVTFPILSVAKMATHEDILFPMRGYQNCLLQAVDYVAWEDKADSLYWRGSTSGQWNRPENWNTSHRSRFIFDTQMWERAASELREAPPNRVKGLMRSILSSEEGRQRDLTQVGLEALYRLPKGTFNVSFTGRTGCESSPKSCDLIEQKAPFASRLPFHAIGESKFLLDIDGQGMSERYYYLLLTNSVVLKQTEWAEWHDEIIVPWIHYVPVSLELSELPSLMDFLINDARGQIISKRMAKESTRWVRSALSMNAQQSYMLRLLFEYSDIMRV